MLHLSYVYGAYYTAILTAFYNLDNPGIFVMTNTWIEHKISKIKQFTSLHPYYCVAIRLDFQKGYKSKILVLQGAGGIVGAVYIGGPGLLYTHGDTTV
jgi:hypothetical protein